MTTNTAKIERISEINPKQQAQGGVDYYTKEKVVQYKLDGVSFICPVNKLEDLRRLIDDTIRYTGWVINKTLRDEVVARTEAFMPLQHNPGPINKKAVKRKKVLKVLSEPSKNSGKKTKNSKRSLWKRAITYLKRSGPTTAARVAHALGIELDASCQLMLDLMRRKKVKRTVIKVKDRGSDKSRYLYKAVA